MQRRFCSKFKDELRLPCPVTYKYFCDYCGGEIREENRLVEVGACAEAKVDVAPGHGPRFRFISLVLVDRYGGHGDIICCIDCMATLLQAAKEKWEKP